ncbi:MAG TPA: phage holin family protein, partial [Pyrinomonadaceae bacterium]|nr:phage holin family protein [Pyrinomonadaceae bacterium]
IMLLDKVMPAWGAALLVGVVVAAIGWLLVGKAMSALQQMEVTPRETVETLKEDAAWMKQQIK